MPDALSCMFQDEEIDSIAAMTPTEDEWYARRREAGPKSPYKYYGWKVLNGELSRYRNNPLLKDRIEEYDAWKLVVPKNLQS